MARTVPDFCSDDNLANVSSLAEQNCFFFPEMSDHYIGLARPADIQAQISKNKWEV